MKKKKPVKRVAKPAVKKIDLAAAAAAAEKQPLKGIVSEEEIISKFKEVKSAAETEEPVELPKGNAIEQTMTPEPGPGTQPPTTQSAAPGTDPRGVKAGTKRGTYKKDKPGQYQKPAEKNTNVDPIATMVNGVVPLAAMKFKKDVKACMITAEQMEMLNNVRPEDKFQEKSWPMYITILLSVVVANVVTAPLSADEKLLMKQQIKAEVIKELKAQGKIVEYSDENNLHRL